MWSNIDILPVSIDKPSPEIHQFFVVTGHSRVSKTISAFGKESLATDIILQWPVAWKGLFDPENQ